MRGQCILSISFKVGSEGMRFSLRSIKGGVEGTWPVFSRRRSLRVVVSSRSEGRSLSAPRQRYRTSFNLAGMAMVSNFLARMSSKRSLC